MRKKTTLRLAFGLFVVFIVGFFLTVNASANSLPGDPLYNFKLGWEVFRINIVLTDNSRQALETQFAQERQEELNLMVETGREGNLVIEGILNGVNGNLWIINNNEILIEPTTIIEGEFSIGSPLSAFVHIYHDGRIVAAKIHFTSDTSATVSPAILQTVSPSHTPGTGRTTESPIESSATSRPTDQETPIPGWTQESTDELDETVEPTDLDDTEEPTQQPTDLDDTEEPTQDFGQTPTPTYMEEPTDETGGFILFQWVTW